MGLLARREHSKLELVHKLQARDFPADLINTAIDDLTKENLQSDERFTENYIRSRSNRGFGPLKIIVELHARGIENPNININDEMWLANAKQTHTKKFGTNPPKDPKSKAKQMRFLQQKGFTNDQIKYALNKNM
jgi:regulatory protein